MAEKPKYYWDACAWIALIQQEPGRFDSLKFVIGEAQGGRVEIWTSNFTLAEVYKRQCDDDQKSLLPQQDQNFEDYILQDFVQRVKSIMMSVYWRGGCCVLIPASKSLRMGSISPPHY